MTEGGFYLPRTTNPKAVAVVVLLHGAALGALLMAKDEVIKRIVDPPITIYQVPVPPPPPPRPVPQPPQPQNAQTRIDTTIPIVKPPPVGPVTSQPDIIDLPPPSRRAQPSSPRPIRSRCPRRLG